MACAKWVDINAEAYYNRNMNNLKLELIKEAETQGFALLTSTNGESSLVNIDCTIGIVFGRDGSMRTYTFDLSRPIKNVAEARAHLSLNSHKNIQTPVYHG